MAAPLSKLGYNSETGGTARVKINKAFSKADANENHLANNDVLIGNGMVAVDDILRRITNIDHDTIDGSTKFDNFTKYEMPQTVPADDAARRDSLKIPSIGSTIELIELYGGSGLGGGLKLKETIVDIYDIKESGIYDGVDVTSMPANLTGYVTIMALERGTGIFTFILTDKDGYLHTGKNIVNGGTYEWKDSDSRVSQLVAALTKFQAMIPNNGAQVGHFSNPAALAIGSCVTVEKDEVKDITVSRDNNIWYITAVDPDDALFVYASKGLTLENIVLDVDGKQTGAVVYYNLAASKFSLNGGIPVGIVQIDHGAKTYDFWFEPTLVSAENEMRGWFDPTIFGGGQTSEPVVNGNNHYREGDYLVARNTGEYDFETGLPGQTPDSVVISTGERVHYTGGKFEILGVPTSRNKGWFDATAAGGGPLVNHPVQDGSADFENADYIICMVGGTYNFTTGTPDVAGKEIKQGERVLFNGTNWVVLANSSSGMMQGWMDATQDGGGSGLPFPIINGSTDYTFGQYVIVDKDGLYDLGSGTAANVTSPTTLKLESGDYLRYTGVTWAVVDVGAAAEFTKLSKKVVQGNHGLPLFAAVRVDATGTWVEADARDIDHIMMGVVSDIIDGNTFEVTYNGLVTGIPHSFTVGKTYYLSANPDGGDIVPDVPNHAVVQKAGFVISSSSVYVMTDVIHVPAITGNTAIVPEFSTDPNKSYFKGSLVKQNGITYRMTKDEVGQPYFPYNSTEKFGSFLAQNQAVTWSTLTNTGNTGVKMQDDKWGWRRGCQNGGILYDKADFGFAWYKGGNHTSTSWNAGGGKSLMHLGEDGLGEIKTAFIKKHQIDAAIGKQELTTSDWVNYQSLGSSQKVRRGYGGISQNQNWYQVMGTNFWLGKGNYIIELQGSAGSTSNCKRWWKLNVIPRGANEAIVDCKWPAGHNEFESMSLYLSIRVTHHTAGNMTVTAHGRNDGANSGHWFVDKGGMTLTVTKVL